MRRWLILDDKYTDQLMAQSAISLIDDAIEVDICTYGSEVLDALKKKTYEVCLLDYYLKGRATSRAVISEIRSRHPSAKTILLSGRSHSDSSLFRLGADAVAMKTGSVSSLTTELKRALLEAENNRRQRVLRSRIQEPYVLLENRHALGQMFRLNRGNFLVLGGSGMGKSSVGLLLAERCRERNFASHGDPMQLVSLRDMRTTSGTRFEAMCHSYFFGNGEAEGALERFRESIFFVDDAHLLPMSVQERLIELYRSGGIRRLNGSVLRADRLRIIWTAEAAFEDNFCTGFRSNVITNVISLPAMRDYWPHLSDLIRHLVRRESRRRGAEEFYLQKGFLTAIKQEMAGHLHAITIRSLTRALEHGIESALAAKSDSMSKFDVEGFRHLLVENGSSQRSEGDRALTVPGGVDANRVKDFMNHLLERSYKDSCQLLFGILYDAHMRAFDGNKSATARAMKVSMKKFYE